MQREIIKQTLRHVSNKQFLLSKSKKKLYFMAESGFSDSRYWIN